LSWEGENDYMKGVMFLPMSIVLRQMW